MVKILERQRVVLALFAVGDVYVSIFNKSTYAPFRVVSQFEILAAVPSIYSSARTELAKLLIYGLFRKIRVLAQDGIGQADLRDVRDVREADGLFAVVNGCPPDEGVMVELGMAIAWEKPVFLFQDDFRRCIDSEGYPLNLMVFTGLPETGWEASSYASIEELADPDKALVRWLRHG